MRKHGLDTASACLEGWELLDMGEISFWTIIPRISYFSCWGHVLWEIVGFVFLIAFLSLWLICIAYNWCACFFREKNHMTGCGVLELKLWDFLFRYGAAICSSYSMSTETFLCVQWGRPNEKASACSEPWKTILHMGLYPQVYFHWL